MKRFMYFSVSVLCLALAALVGFHIGNQPATAQVAPASVVGTFGTLYNHVVLLANGDVYYRDATDLGCEVGHMCYQNQSPATYVGNFWGGQPVPTAPSTLGGVKAKYR